MGFRFSAKVATQVRGMAKRRRLSATRMLVELVEEGLEAKQRKEKAPFSRQGVPSLKF